MRVASLANEAAHSLRGGHVALVVIDREKNPGFAWRWVLAHELGHIACDGYHDDFVRCTSERRTSARRVVENRASDFGTLLTMPDAMFAPRWREAGAPTLDAVRYMARTFAVPADAAALRALAFEGSACAVVFTAPASDGALRVKWWARSNDRFDATIRWGRRVHEETIAHALHRGASERRLAPRRIPSSHWGTTSDGTDVIEARDARPKPGVLT